ncbi:MAG: DUF3788 domain-containing protein [Tannerellaceae bacterium]|jgi:hypothetical protein|nr:DUF3788 domain-containing protein [Tannerellaceae bacterium]
MDKPLLNEQTIFPSKEVLKGILADSYPVFEELSTILTNEHGLVLEWNYYNDGKRWLCKVLNKKKNLFWLSVWNKSFQASFYFTEKHLESFAALDISETLKEDLCRTKPIGKLLPLLLKIRTNEQLPDLLKIVEFKKNLK